MALRKIVLQGDECLTKVCRPVTEFNQRLHTLIDDMKETLLDSGGVGLAAPQVGVLRRVCVVMNEDEDIIELVNPEIIAAEGEQTGLEGCLSIPGKFGIVTRPYTVRVRAQDRDGNFFEDAPPLPRTPVRRRSSGRRPCDLRCRREWRRGSASPWRPPHGCAGPVCCFPGSVLPCRLCPPLPYRMVLCTQYNILV